MPDRLRDSGASQLTLLLKQMQKGDQRAGEEAVGLVYTELHRIAALQLRREGPRQTLVTTALIHETYLRLVGGSAFAIESRGHFLAIASQQMRRILVDHARARNAQRRGGGAIQVSLEQAEPGSGPPDLDVLLLDDSLRELQRLDPRAAQVVELSISGATPIKK